MIARYFIHTSAAARMHRPLIAERLTPLITAGVVATCAVLDAEALYSARDTTDYERIRADRNIAYQYIPTGDEHWSAALEAQRALARTGRHRAVGVFDLLTAVLAAQHQLTIVHYDADFDIASDVLDFPHHWVTPPGTA